jgi:general secretion pathway protein H
MRGFTLLELLAVLFIIGIIVSFAGLSVSQHSSRTLQDEAERIHSLLRLASEEAVLQGRELAVQFTRQDYRFMTSDGAQWAPIEDDKLLRARELPPGMEVELQLEGVKADFGNEENPPRIFILSSSEMTPFVLTLRMADGEAYAVEGGLNGDLTLKRLAEK